MTSDQIPEGGLTPGTLIDNRYEVISQIGDGGMGIVYKVRHKHLHKECALKVMRPTRDTVDRQRFEQEAQIASKIRHDNVVEISDFGILHTNQPYFVMEFLKGQTLGSAIYKGGIDVMLACTIAMQIASGLQAVHKQHIVHRDLKPDNIFLVDPSDQESQVRTSQPGIEVRPVHFVKIMDFGIAKAVDKNLTGAGMTLGTPEYMSPEQATGDKLDWRSDEYSLGCILYEMLTGELPFDGKGAFEVMQKHLTEAPMPPRKRRPELADTIPSALEKIVLTAMAKRPSDRYQQMRLMESALRDVVAGVKRARTQSVVPAVRDTMLLKPGGAPTSLPADVTMRPGQARARSETDTEKQLPQVATVISQPPSMNSRATMPVVPALPSKNLPPTEPLPPVATVVMPPDGKSGRETPTPRLLEKLLMHVQDAPVELASPLRWWHKVPLLHAVVEFFKRLFGKA